MKKFIKAAAFFFPGVFLTTTLMAFTSGCGIYIAAIAGAQTTGIIALAIITAIGTVKILSKDS